MKYLLDTNILSETTRIHPNENVKKWLRDISPSALFISVLTIGEIRRGIQQLAHGSKRERLKRWLEDDLLQWFDHRILPVTLEISERWGELTAPVPPLKAIDSLLATTALAHRLTLVTRNTRDFQVEDLKLFNPFVK